jgi:hypothetical protein
MDEELKKLKNRVAQWELDTDGASYCMACENLYALISAAERERELVEALREAARVLRLYREGVPLGHQPHMTADKADAALLRAARALQAKDPTP